jgi:hypothetical protein
MIIASVPMIAMEVTGSDNDHPLGNRIDLLGGSEDSILFKGSEMNPGRVEGYQNPFPLCPAMMKTRVSDTEQEADAHDYSNGSRIESDGEKISGSLTYDPSGESDIRDWYKLSAVDVDPSPGAVNGPRNISIIMTSYLDGNDGRDDLYELSTVPSTVPGQYELEHDYFDYMMIFVKYYDPWMGMMDIGGTDFYYDDGDPSDSWEHSGNWSFDFSTPVPSTGPEDEDGLLNGLEEVGWYYISFTMNWRMKEDAPDRDGFSVNYGFDIRTDDRDITDDGANIRQEAGNLMDGGSRRIQSAFDPVDWYGFEGVDDEKLWKMKFTFNRTLGAGLVDEDDGIVKDTYQYFFILFPDKGEDGIWNTDDDGWVYYWWIYSFYISNSNTVESGRPVVFTINNTWIEASNREVYIGTYVKPVTASFEGSEITGFLYPDWTTFSDYTIDVEITEETVNRRPVLENLAVSSDNEFHGTSGDLSDEFSFEVMYRDEDGDEPDRLELFIDPGTGNERSFSMLDDHDGGDLETGRRYHLVLDGEEIGKGEHDLMMNCSDGMQEGSLRRSLDSKPLHLNVTMEVWDDDVVEFIPGDPVDPIYEDQGRVMIPLEFHNGGWFNDPERSFTDFRIWNDISGEWAGDQLQEIIRIEMIYREGDGWYASLETVKDMHGSGLMRIRASDEHSHIERNISFEVLSVNDPPVLEGFEFNGEEVDFDVSNPSVIEVDLRSFDVVEDDQYTFGIHGIDSDPEEDRTSIRYSFVDSGKGDWSVDPEIDHDTGEVRFTPVNSDVGVNSWMKFRITDGTDSIDVRVMMNVRNSPDDPSLYLSMKGSTVYQGATWILESRSEDIDPSDVHSFSVNMEDEVAGYQSVADQLEGDVIGVDLIYDFDPATGYLSITPIGDEIWRGTDSLEEEVTITIAIEVKDIDGRTDFRIANLTLLKDGPWIPDVPDFTIDIRDEDPDEPGKQGLTISVSSDEMDSVYGEGWIYTWTLGDGNDMTGRNFTHTYQPSGPGQSFTYNIKLKLVKGEYSTREKTGSVTLMVPSEDEEKKDEGDFMTYLAVIAIAFVIIMVVVLLFFMIRRRSKPIENPPIEMVNPGMTARPEVPQTFVKQTEENTPVIVCPNCGSPVQKEWFLCPECKDTLKW